MITPRIGTNFEDHQMAVNKEKMAWNQFFWPDTSQGQEYDLIWYFEQFLQMLKKKIVHKQILDNKDKAKAKEEMQKVVVLNLLRLRGDLTLSDLKDVLKKVMNLDVDPISEPDAFAMQLESDMQDDDMHQRV